MWKISIDHLTIHLLTLLHTRKIYPNMICLHFDLAELPRAPSGSIIRYCNTSCGYCSSRQEEWPKHDMSSSSDFDETGRTTREKLPFKQKNNLPNCPRVTELCVNIHNIYT